jgi:hypothetical protein
MITVPDISTVPEFYKNYVRLVQHLPLREALRVNPSLAVVRHLPEEKGEYRYAPGKWSVKELVVHMMDAERIFAYRALRFSRGDQTPLHSFDENMYAPRSNAHSRTLMQLADEFSRLRTSTQDLFAGFTDDMMTCWGTVNGNVLSVANLGYIIAGHEAHHLKVLNDRYLV